MTYSIWGGLLSVYLPCLLTSSNHCFVLRKVLSASKDFFSYILPCLQPLAATSLCSVAIWSTSEGFLSANLTQVSAAGLAHGEYLVCFEGISHSWSALPPAFGVPPVCSGKILGNRRGYWNAKSSCYLKQSVISLLVLLIFPHPCLLWIPPHLVILP